MSDDDIDFLLDDDDDQQQQQQQANTNGMNLEKNNLIGQNDDDDDDDEGAFDGYLEGDHEDEEDGDDEDASQKDDEDDENDNYLYKNLDDGEWTEDDVKVLLAKVDQLRDRFQTVSRKIVAHPLIWVPLNASSAAANDAKSVFQQQAHGSIYFINGLAKIGHRLNTETKLLKRHLESGQYSRAKCNNLAFLEIFVRVLEIEKGVLFVSVTLPLRAKKFERLRYDNSIEMDIITRGGLRWIKIRGSSARNLESDVVVDFDEKDEDDEEQEQIIISSTTNQNDDDYQQQAKRIIDKKVITPFTQLLARVSRCATKNSLSLRLPFSSTPEALMICSDTPSPKTISTLKRHAPNLKLIDNNKLVKLQHGLQPLEYDVQCINFDVTAMVAMCSDITNNEDPEKQLHSNSFPQNPVLQRQADMERGGQLCIENFIAPVLSEFSEVFNTTSKINNSKGNNNNSNSRLSQKVEQMFEKGSALDVCLRRPESERKFWRKLLLDEQNLELEKRGLPKKNVSSTDDDNDDDNNQEEELDVVDIDFDLIEGLAPRMEVRNPGCLFGIKSSSSKKNTKNNTNSHHNNNDHHQQQKSFYPSNWIVAAAAVGELSWIVSTISGPTERRRAIWLLKRLRVVDTDKQEGIHDRLRSSFTSAVAAATTGTTTVTSTASSVIKKEENTNDDDEEDTAITTAATEPASSSTTDESFKTKTPKPPPSSKEGGPHHQILPNAALNVKQRQLNVFSLGDVTNSVTISANKAFLHSAFECGQLLCCSTHPARALTERKRLGQDTKPGRDKWREGNKPASSKDKF